MTVRGGVPYAEYAEIPGVNFSTLKHMDESPLHYLEATKAPLKESTDAMDLGTAVHMAILEPDRLKSDVVFWTGRRAGKAYDEWKAANAGRLQLRAQELAGLMAMVRAVERHKEASALVKDLRTEVVYTWTDEATGLPCKCRLDGRKPGLIVDLKTARDLNHRALGAQAARLKYHVQLAHYAAGVKACEGEYPRCYILAVENQPPHDVGVLRMDPNTLRLGEDKRRELLERVASCTESGEWPGRYPEAIDLEMPEWVWPSDEDFTVEE